jgi:hypothetical protein
MSVKNWIEWRETLEYFLILESFCDKMGEVPRTQVISTKRLIFIKRQVISPPSECQNHLGIRYFSTLSTHDCKPLNLPLKIDFLNLRKLVGFQRRKRKVKIQWVTAGCQGNATQVWNRNEYDFSSLSEECHSYFLLFLKDISAHRSRTMVHFMNSLSLSEFIVRHNALTKVAQLLWGVHEPPQKLIDTSKNLSIVDRKEFNVRDER